MENPLMNLAAKVTSFVKKQIFLRTIYAVN